MIRGWVFCLFVFQTTIFSYKREERPPHLSSFFLFQFLLEIHHFPQSPWVNEDLAATSRFSRHKRRHCGRTRLGMKYVFALIMSLFFVYMNFSFLLNALFLIQCFYLFLCFSLDCIVILGLKSFEWNSFALILILECFRIDFSKFFLVIFAFSNA